MSPQILGFIVNVFSILALPYSIYKFDLIEVHEKYRAFFAILALFVALYVVGKSVYDHYKNRRHKVYKGDEAVNKEMARIIKESGKTVILSRNMSWAEGQIIIDALTEKSKNDDLKIYLQGSGAKLKSIANYDSVVKIYSDEYVPSCRFTIKKFGSFAESIYISVPTQNEHHIYRYESKDGPIFHLAKDLIHLLEVK